MTCTDSHSRLEVDKDKNKCNDPTKSMLSSSAAGSNVFKTVITASFYRCKICKKIIMYIYIFVYTHNVIVIYNMQCIHIDLFIRANIYKCAYTYRHI